MSLSDTPAYCEDSDVQKAMQEVDLSFGETPLGTDNVEAAIFAASEWFGRQSDTHFYDSGGTASDLISTTAKTATDIRLSIPASPHRQEGQLFVNSDSGAVTKDYPNTTVGRYARAVTPSGKPRLPKNHVESVDRLAVRQLGGETEDWVAGSQTEGRGEDYYLQVDGGDAYGRSYLYLYAPSIGPRINFEELVEADFTYGLDWQDEPWADVRRGVAHLAAAELVTDDDVLTSIPENVSLANVETEAQLHLKAAMEQPGYLDGYLSRGIA